MAMKPAGGTRHTPAPWRKEMGEINATIDESDYLIADASGDNDLSFDEAQANAELIADAPELLRLLQVAYRALRRMATCRRALPRKSPTRFNLS
jgi:hypothetical protein